LGSMLFWTSPIYRSPMADFDYAVADYCYVDQILSVRFGERSL
jgi:glycosidase